MTKKSSQKNQKTIVWIAIIIYMVELVWFFYSQIAKPLMNNQKLSISSIELAIILTIGLLAVVMFLLLKKKRKISGIIMAVLGVSVIVFGIIAPLLDVYIPVIWQIFQQIK